jgi:FkbM family methyltransferase
MTSATQPLPPAAATRENPIMRRLRKLFTHPAFKAQPFAVLARTAAWALCVLVRRSPVFSLTSAGERLRVPADLRFTSLSSFILRDWTEPELRELAQFVRRDTVFIDIGANVGLYSLKAARLVGPGGTVVAVEPGRVAADQLERNLALNPFRNVRVVRAALADKIGTAALYHVPLGDDPQAFSLLSDGSAVETETVATTTLDALVAELDLPSVDCLKIDVEGAEPLVLAGAQQTLARWRPMVIFEINASLSGSSGPPPDAAWRALAGFGYRFHRLQGQAMTEIDRMPEAFGNIVARHPARDATNDGSA